MMASVPSASRIPRTSGSLGHRTTCPPSPRGRLSRPPTPTGTPSPWGSRPTGDPAFSDRQTSERDVGAPFAPLSDLAGRRSPAGRLPAEGLNPPYAGDPAMDVVVGESSGLPLRAGVQAVEPSPYRAGLARRRRTRLRAPPASPACCCPVRLSPSGKPLTRRCFLPDLLRLRRESTER